MPRKHVFKIRAVIFDMDGVITNTMPDHYKAWHAALKEIGLDVTRLDIYSREGQRGAESIREILKEYGRDCSPGLARRFLARKEEIFKKISRQRFIPGSRAYVRALARQGFQLALVTGTSRHELHRILPESLYRLFSVTVTGTDVKNGKPHPEPFLKALRKLGIKKTQAVVIENAPFGIAAARAAGLPCLALETSLPKKHLKEADAVFHSFNHLKQNVNFMRMPN